MTQPRTQQNPYSTPQQQDSPPQPRRRRLWQLALAAVLGFFGAIGVVGNLGYILLLFAQTYPYRWSDMPWAFRFWELELRLVATLLSGAWLAAALMTVRNRWKLGLLLAAVAGLGMLANPPVHNLLRHHFAGDSWELPSSEEPFDY